MQNSDSSRIFFLVSAAIGIVFLVAFAICIVLSADTIEDPSITASYKSLRKKLKHESPLPAELTAEFQLSREGHWIANGPITDLQVEELASRNQNLDVVVIIGGDVTPAGLSKLQDKHVRRLKIHYTELNSEFFDVFSKFKRLERLDLRAKLIDDEMIAHLIGPKLNELRLRETKITERGVRHIVKSFPSVEEIEVSGDTYFDDKCLGLLKGLRKLDEVDVSGTSVTESALLDFLKNERINEVGIGDLHLDDEFVAKLPTRLESLDLSYNPITDASVDTIAQMRDLQLFRLMGKSMVTTDGLERLRRQLPGCEIYCTKKSRDAEPKYDDKHI